MFHNAEFIGTPLLDVECLKGLQDRDNGMLIGTYTHLLDGVISND